MHDHSPRESDFRPHPLALDLIARLADQPAARVLEIGAGSGRNARALTAAGLRVTSVEPGQPFSGDGYEGALSTHGLLHGTAPDIAALLAQIADALVAGAPLFATFGSIRDARFGQGERIAPNTFAPESGDEAGVPHTYFDERSLRELLESGFFVESLREASVDAIMGRWAHANQLTGSVHLFATARRR